jgi:hypothetical protein
MKGEYVPEVTPEMIEAGLDALDEAMGPGVHPDSPRRIREKLVIQIFLAMLSKGHKGDLSEAI